MTSWLASIKTKIFGPKTIETLVAKGESEKPKARNWNAEVEDILRALEQSQKSDETMEELLGAFEEVITAKDFNPEQLSFEILKKICGVEIISQGLNKKIEDILFKTNLYSVIHKTFKKKTAEYFFEKTENLMREFDVLSKKGKWDEKIVEQIDQKLFVFLSPAHMLYLWDKFSPKEESASSRYSVLQVAVNNQYWALGREIHNLAEQASRKQQGSDLGDLLSEEEKAVLAQAEEILFNKAMPNAEAQGKSKYARASDTLQAYKDSSKTGVSAVFSVYCLLYKIIHQFSEEKFYDYTRLLQEHSPSLSSFEKKFIEEQLSSIIPPLKEGWDETKAFTGVLRKLDIILRISRVELLRLQKQLADKKDKDLKGDIVLARGYTEEFEKNIALLKGHESREILILAIKWMIDKANLINKLYPQDKETAIEALCPLLADVRDEARKEARMALNSLEAGYERLFKYYIGLFSGGYISPTVLLEGINYLEENIERIKRPENYSDREKVIKSLYPCLINFDNKLRKKTRVLLEKLGVDENDMFTYYTELLGDKYIYSGPLEEAAEFLRNNTASVLAEKKDLAYKALFPHSNRSLLEGAKKQVLKALEVLRPAVNLPRKTPFAQGLTIEQAI